MIRDLRLAERGLVIVERPFSNFVPLADGRFFSFGGDADATRREVAKFSARDAEALGAYYARLDRLADQLKKWVLRAPPNLGGPLVVQGLRDAAAAARLLLDFGALPTGGKRDLIDVFTKSAGHWLDATFESEPLKAVLGWDSVVGNYASPYAAGSAYVLLHHCFGEVNGKAGRWGHAIGGMGRITELMADEARARGVQIDVGHGVQRVLVERGAAVGVLTERGAEIRCRGVVSNVHPQLLYQRLIDATRCLRSSARRSAAIAAARARCASTSRCRRCPTFACAPGTTPLPHHASGIVFAPSLAYMDRAWLDAAGGRFFGAADRRDVDPERGRRLARAEGRACREPVLPAVQARRRLGSAEGERRCRRCSTSCSRTARTSARRCSATARSRRWISSASSVSSAATSFTASSRSTSCFPCGRCSGYARYRGPLSGLYHCGSGAHPGRRRHRGAGTQRRG